MKQRIITGTVLCLILIPLLLVKELFPLFQVTMLVLAVIASTEMIRLYEKEKKLPLCVKIIIVLGTALIYMSCLTEWAKFVKNTTGLNDSISSHILHLFNLEIGFLPMILVVVITLLACMVFCHNFDGGDVGKALTSICYTGLGFGALTILRFLGLRFIVYLLLITILTDVFAYFGGSKFGKHKMCPKISPHKTWEGAVIGSFIAVLCATIIAYFYGNFFKGGYFNEDGIKTLFSNSSGVSVFWKGNFDKLNSFWQFVAIFGISIFISVAGQVGDLVASKLKRTYGLKDYGNIFPGHGGVLDRLDSAIFAALALLLIFVIF
ncbi:MAG: phosphatidate cytidylyltransferase [Acholeplasmatales bacterium]|nr:phosphatidate cytidylyltransferase [Acholeplasmatales bacterium]